jgi:hypothetical protein
LTYPIIVTAAGDRLMTAGIPELPLLRLF